MYTNIRKYTYIILYIYIYRYIIKICFLLVISLNSMVSCPHQMGFPSSPLPFSPHSSARLNGVQRESGRRAKRSPGGQRFPWFSWQQTSDIWGVGHGGSGKKITKMDGLCSLFHGKSYLEMGVSPK